jgi:hypothetical protein
MCVTSDSKIYVVLLEALDLGGGGGGGKKHCFFLIQFIHLCCSRCGNVSQRVLF